MRKFELKVVDGKLVIDLNSEPDMKSIGMPVRGYDGVPNKYDICDLGPAPVIGTVELSDEALAKIDAEYQNGGQCAWCDEVRPKLRPPHMFDRDRDGGRMCEHCWNHDRKMYKGSYGEDIGPFEEEGEGGEEDDSSDLTV